MDEKQSTIKNRKRNKRKKKQKAALMKIIPVLVAVVLIIAVVGIFYGQKIIDKYSYSKEFKNLYEYYDLAGDQDMAIVINDEKSSYKGIYENGMVYLPFELVEETLSDHFYINRDEGIILYATDSDIYKAVIDNESNCYYLSGAEVATEFNPAISKGQQIYMAADYVSKFVGMCYDLYQEPTHVSIYTREVQNQIVVAKKDTAVRFQGGVKSPILEEVPAGGIMYLMGEMEDWAQVRSKQGYVGYVEIKHFQENGDVETKSIPTPEAALNYQQIAMDGLVNMAFHQVFGEAANATFDDYTSNAVGVNVIAPTWFRLLDSEGTVEDISSKDYVSKAHGKGMQVWAVWTDVDYKIDLKPILHNTDKRRTLIDKMVSSAVNLGIEGINIDFETLKSEAGEDFEEFIRELSIETHKNNLVLSIDNYAPTASTAHYNRKEQGLVADYVIIMGYDEHWSTSKEAGSVASIDYVETGIQRTLESVPANKVINAVPFYTRIWKTEGGQVSCDTVGIPAARKWIAENGVELFFDDFTCQNYGEKTIDGVFYQVWMEDDESLSSKLSVMHSYSLAGVAEWKLGLEENSFWNTIQGYMLMETN